MFKQNFEDKVKKLLRAISYLYNEGTISLSETHELKIKLQDLINVVEEEVDLE